MPRPIIWIRVSHQNPNITEISRFQAGFHQFGNHWMIRQCFKFIFHSLSSDIISALNITPPWNLNLWKFDYYCKNIIFLGSLCLDSLIWKKKGRNIIMTCVLRIKSMNEAFFYISGALVLSDPWSRTDHALWKNSHFGNLPCKQIF